jgi:hypothetical protein
MTLRQVDLVKKWGCSRGLISQYCSRGMPLSSFHEAERWIRTNISGCRIDFDPEYGRKLADAAFRGGPDLEPEDDDSYERMSPEEYAEYRQTQAKYEKILRDAWRKFKNEPVLDEDAPGFSEATLLGCWALDGLTARGVSESDAFDFVNCALECCISDRVPDYDPWQPFPPSKAATKKLPSRGGA